jgi:hypothetical protein
MNTDHDLRRVQLFGTAKPKPERGLVPTVLIAFAKGAVVAFAVVGVAFTVAVLIEVTVPVAKTAKVTT